MRRMAACVLVLAGCDGDVKVTDGDGGAPTGGQAQGGAPEAGASAGGGDTGYTVWPGQTYSHTGCMESEPYLFVEIWPDAAAKCVANPALIDVLVIRIDNWDLTAGTFVLDEPTPHGTAYASKGSPAEPATGVIVLSPFTDVPTGLSWEIDGETGSTDLSVCHHPLSEPCAKPI